MAIESAAGLSTLRELHKWTLIARTLAAICVLGVARSAMAGSIYDESVSGDLSDGAPSVLPIGTTGIRGTKGLNGDIQDNFIISLPHTGGPTNLLIDYTVSTGINDTLAINFASTHTIFGKTIQAPGPFTAGHFDFTVAANESLKLLVWNPESGPAAYSIDITVVPEPRALGVVGLGAIGLLRRRRQIVKGLGNGN